MTKEVFMAQQDYTCKKHGQDTQSIASDNGQKSRQHQEYKPQQLMPVCPTTRSSAARF